MGTPRPPAASLARGDGTNPGNLVIATWRDLDDHPSVALELRPNCEHCGVDLRPASPEAMICSFECTFCRECADHALGNVCPNCGGGFCPRPIRPNTNWKGDNDLAHYPASTVRRHRPVDLDAHREFARAIAPIPTVAR